MTCPAHGGGYALLQENKRLREEVAQKNARIERMGADYIALEEKYVALVNATKPPTSDSDEGGYDTDGTGE